MNMKKLSYFIVFIIFVSVSPLKSEAKNFQRPSYQSLDHRESTANFIYQPLQKIESTLKKETYEESNAQTIPVYLIMSPKGNTRTEDKSPPIIDKVFDTKGMIYITKPKATRSGQHRITILDDIDKIERRSYSSNEKNQRALRTFVNQELNKKLLANKTMRRFLNKYDKEYNFNELVINTEAPLNYCV